MYSAVLQVQMCGQEIHHQQSRIQRGY